MAVEVVFELFKFQFNEEPSVLGGSACPGCKGRQFYILQKSFQTNQNIQLFIEAYWTTTIYQSQATLLQVYDDNDDYSEDNDREDEAVGRPKFGLDIFSVFVPVSNFFSVIWKLFCTFVLKMEKTVSQPNLSETSKSTNTGPRFKIIFFSCNCQSLCS